MRPKYSKKIKWIIILAIIYLLFIFNIHKIRFGLNMLTHYNSEKDIVVEEDVHSDDNISKVKNPLDTILTPPTETNEKITPIKNDTNKPVQTSETEVKPSVPSASNDKADKSKSYDTIIKKYNQQLEDLRITFETELQALISQGIEEYNKEGSSAVILANKYLKLGTNLEKSSDNRFEKVLKDMDRELLVNNYDNKITKEVKSYYKDFKNAMKKDLIARGMKHMNK